VAWATNPRPKFLTAKAPRDAKGRPACETGRSGEWAKGKRPWHCVSPARPFATHFPTLVVLAAPVAALGPDGFSDRGPRTTLHEQALLSGLQDHTASKYHFSSKTHTP
jgi:hypothetical protein